MKPIPPLAALIFVAAACISSLQAEEIKSDATAKKPAEAKEETKPSLDYYYFDG